MSDYYVNTNAQSNGDHEVHKDGCYWLTLVKQPEFLGDYASCATAVSVAKARGYDANGCYYCSKACHTT